MGLVKNGCGFLDNGILKSVSQELTNRADYFYADTNSRNLESYRDNLRVVMVMLYLKNELMSWPGLLHADSDATIFG